MKGVNEGGILRGKKKALPKQRGGLYMVLR
jgi:hypothetical protein